MYVEIKRPFLCCVRLNTIQRDLWVRPVRFIHLMMDETAPNPQDRQVKLAHAVPLTAAINNKRAHRLVQIAFEMPEKANYTPIHAIMNSWTRLHRGSLRDWNQYEWTVKVRCMVCTSHHNLKSCPKPEFIWMPMDSLKNPFRPPSQPAIARIVLSVGGGGQLEMDIYTFV